MKIIDAVGTSIVGWLERRRHSKVAAHLRGRLLDIGCGPNLLVRQYAQKQGKGIGVDVYNFGDADLVVPNTANLPFPDRSFETITLMACLNHIPNRLQVLREAHRLLTDDGQLLLTMIPPLLSKVWHWLIFRYDEDQTERKMKEGEVWGFTRRQMIEMLQATGYELGRHERFVFGLNHLYVARKTGQATRLAA
jgi:ubiquinone/menaquinone biosynthesis C-methylase UbiE